MIVTSPLSLTVVSNGVMIEESRLAQRLAADALETVGADPSWFIRLRRAIRVASCPARAAGGRCKGGVPADRDAGSKLSRSCRGGRSSFHARIGTVSYEKLANVRRSASEGGTNTQRDLLRERCVNSGRVPWCTRSPPVVGQCSHRARLGRGVAERGLATYFALLFTEHDEGRDAFVDGVSAHRERVLQLERKLPTRRWFHRNWPQTGEPKNGLVYQKGAWVLHMLRAEVGTELFWKAIRDYYSRYRDQNASTAELRAIFEQVSGKPLDWLFAQWLTRPGVPKVEGSWRYLPARKAIEVTLSQTQVGDPFKLSWSTSVLPPSMARRRRERMELAGRTATRMFSVGRGARGGDTGSQPLVADGGRAFTKRP